MSRFKSSRYKNVSSRDDISLTSEDYHEKEPPKSRWPRKSTIILSIATLVFGLHSLYISIWGGNKCTSQAFNDGYVTEWSPAKESIMIQEVTYTSAIRFNATSKTYYRDFDPSRPQYVGRPSPEIDKAWADLLEGQYLAITKEEAFQLDDPVNFKGFYIAEVEVMHSLHCLNALRKAISPEYYTKEAEHPLLRKVKDMHIDHCLEQIRQNIQCAGDLTPLMLRPWGEGENSLLIGTPQVHTCRNWDSFRTWYTERGTKLGKIGTTAV